MAYLPVGEFPGQIMAGVEAKGGNCDLMSVDGGCMHSERRNWFEQPEAKAFLDNCERNRIHERGTHRPEAQDE